MDTLTRTTTCHGTTLSLSTSQPTTFVDVTDHLEQFVAETHVRTGTVTIQTTHTTTAIIVNEHEPLLLLDFAVLLDRLAPCAAAYRHDDMARRSNVPRDEPRNGHAHCRALLLPTSVSLTIVNGRLVMGRWQRVLLIELDGPRRRDVSIVVVGEGGL